MKKAIFMLLILSFVICFGACQEEKSESDRYFDFESGLEYWVMSDGNLCVFYGEKAECPAEIVIPPTYMGRDVTKIAADAFSYQTNLKTIHIPNSITTIEDSAFLACSSLTSITIPDSVTYIGAQAFRECENLTTLTISDGVTSLGNFAFGGCKKLTEIFIPDNVTSIGTGAFSSCSGLIAIKVGEGNPVYHSMDNCLIETESKTLIRGCKNSLIPSDGSVTSIGDVSFEGCSSLTSITIPDNVTRIGASAFGGCTQLEEITVPFVGATCDDADTAEFQYIFGKYRAPKSLKKVVISGTSPIPEGAFAGCNYLESIIISHGVTSIGDEAFAWCKSLSSIVIPNSITDIGYDSFGTASDHLDIYYAGGEEEWEDIHKSYRWDLNISNHTIHYNYGA